eukprot:gene10309-biopygen15535
MGVSFIEGRNFCAMDCDIVHASDYGRPIGVAGPVGRFGSFFKNRPTGHLAILTDWPKTGQTQPKTASNVQSNFVPTRQSNQQDWTGRPIGWLAGRPAAGGDRIYGIIYENLRKIY